MNDFLNQHPEWREHADLLLMPPTAQEVLEEFPDSQGCSLLADESALASDGSTRLALYVRLRREGKDHRWSDMMASQRAPRGMTDSVFFEGGKRAGDEFDDQYLNKIVTASKKRGFNPPENARYFPSLARFRGDPEAWVSHSQGRGYIRKLCEKRGWACEGAVNLEARQPESDPYAKSVPMHRNLVRQYAREMINANPELKRKSRRELRQMILDKHGPSK